MTKLVIQIPCFNEEETLPTALAALPRELPGIDVVEWLLIDDGSVDKSVEVARRLGVDHVVSLPRNQGLAKAFMAGIEAALRVGADIIVNTDADNQYCADDIGNLVVPILNGEAEMVIGTRPINEIRQFSSLKKILQRIGSWVVRKASTSSVEDAPSGFRAISRNAAMQLNVFTGFSFSLETIIQAGRKNIAIASVPIRVNEVKRPSRLMKNTFDYVLNSGLTIFRVFVVYRPMFFFCIIGILFFLTGSGLGVRFVYFYLLGEGDGHVQSLILAALLIGMGFLIIMVGILADLIAVNRQLGEQINWRLRRLELHVNNGNPAADKEPRAVSGSTVGESST